MSLNVYLYAIKPCEVFNSNLTHNFGKMATEAGIYDYIWRPDKIGIGRAGELIIPLKIGLMKMQSEPQRFKKFDALDGWGTYEQLVPWLENYLHACIEFPDAEVRVSR
jgi:hypothetical protein